MGQFIDYSITYHIALTNKALHDRVKLNLLKLELPYKDSNREGASVCILDAALYLSNKSFYNENYEVCLKILYEEDYSSIDEILSDGAIFVLRHNFTSHELENALLFINEHLTHKFQSQILQTIFDSAHNSLVITNTEGIIQYANRYFLRATGYESDELLGEVPRLIRSGFHNNEFYQDLWNTISSGSVWNGFFVNQRKDSILFYEEATISPIYNTLGQIVNYLKIGKLVERERLLNQELNEEIKLAQELMAYMLPRDYSDDFIRFHSKVRAYNYLGGDFVCFEPLSDTKYAIGIIDVVGHSASSAFIGLKAISVFQSIIHYDNLEKSVSKVNEAINLINEADLAEVRYLSGIFMVVDIKANFISYINAGHPAFYAKQQDKLLKFESNNMILGITNHKTFEIDSIVLDPISYLFLYSDGLIENEKEKLAQADHRLEHALLHAEKSELSFMESVLDEMVGTSEYSDDITMCYVEFK